MNKPSANFLRICEIAKIEPEQAGGLWLEIWQKAIRNFLSWLIHENSLSSKQSQSLLEVMESIKKDGPRDKSVADWVFPLLSEEQKIYASQKFACFLLDSFQEFYQKVIINLTSEKQVLVEGYLKNNYVR